MLECPHDLRWSHWPLRTRPRQLILLLAIMILTASLVYYWLGWNWTSNALIVAFVFSLRNLLFAKNYLIAEDGVSLSHPLSGAKRWKWASVERLELKGSLLILSLLNKKSVELPAPEAPLHAELLAWIQWQSQPPSTES
jgi:hypothetical protein